MSTQKLISWNVNGIRAALRKGFHESMSEIDPDIICLQETKAQDDQIQKALFGMEGYELYHNPAERKGYSGVAILSKKPVPVSLGIDHSEHDGEGRVITADMGNYWLVNVYVPNSGRELVRLDYRQTWDESFKAYLKNLEQEKPVVVCGDFNVAHQPIDIARPKSNYNKTAGYTQKEIDGFSGFLQEGLHDTFRMHYPDKIKYSWWSYRANARAKNVGWRIDYVLVSDSLKENVRDSFILNDIHGSDHCPVGIVLSAK